ncbi:MAG: hypothetical protein IT385_05000 [Deltaproteobacteria bacterium]|nr:hypothetical protein [Deltaproteobacteria bacterium]
MARSDLPRALACLRDPNAAPTDRAAAIGVVARELTTGGVDPRDARDAISALHRARDADPAGPLATIVIEALARAVGLRVGGDPRVAPDGAWGLPALLGPDVPAARWAHADHAGESWRLDCPSATHARALAERLEAARLADVSWTLAGARLTIDRRATQRSATDWWRDLGALPPPVDDAGLPRPLGDDDVAARLDRFADEVALGALHDPGPLSDRWVDLVEYVHGVEGRGVRASGLPSLRRVVTSGADLAHVRAVMVDDLDALADVVRAAAAELGVGVDVTIDDDVFTIRGAGRASERRGALADLLRARLQEAGYGHELRIHPLADGPDGGDAWLGHIQAYTTRARIQELARADVMFLHYLPDHLPHSGARGPARVIFLGRAGGSLFFAHHLERTLAQAPSDARVFVLSRHTAPPRLLALVRGLIDQAIYDDRALAAGAFSYRATRGEALDDVVLRGIDLAAAADPALAAEVQALHDLAVGAGLIDGLRPGAEILIVDERGHGPFPLMLRHALERAPRRTGPAVQARWFVGDNRSPMTDYPRLDPARLTADFGWTSPGRVIEAASTQAEHVPQPLAGPRYRGRDVAPLGHALELDSLRVRAGALVKNLWLYDGWLRAHAELPLIPLAAARDDPRAPPEARALAARHLAARMTDAQADLYGIITDGHM